MVFDGNTLAVSSFVGFREYDWELRRTLSAIQEVPNDPDALELMQALAHVKANLNAARVTASPGSTWTESGVPMGAVPAALLPIPVPPNIPGGPVHSASDVIHAPGAEFAVSAYLFDVTGVGVVTKPTLLSLLKNAIKKLIFHDDSVTVIFEDGSTMAFEYTGILYAGVAYKPIHGSEVFPSSSGGGGGGGEGGTGGGGGGGGFTFFRVCINGTVSFPGGVSHNFVCFLTLTP